MRIRHGQLKSQARQLLAKHNRVFFTIGVTLLCLTLLVAFLQTFGGGFMVYMPLDLTQFPMETGAWPADVDLMTDLLALGGFSGLIPTAGMVFALRFEPANVVVVFLMPWGLCISFFVTQFIVVLIQAPFRQGTLEQLYKMSMGQEPSRTDPFQWYLRPRLLYRALVVQIGLGVCKSLSFLLFYLPAVAIAFSQTSNSILLTISLLFSSMGPLVSYYLYCLVLPAQYVLAQDPTISPWTALAQGTQLTRNHRKIFFSFRLSFVLWNLFALFFNNFPDAYIFPYEEQATLLLLRTLKEGPPVQEPQPEL